jgi:hypothetical protein
MNDAKLILDKKTEKLLLAKLRQPIHKSYISKYILKTNEDLCNLILDKLVSCGKIKQTEFKGYYVLN